MKLQRNKSKIKIIGNDIYLDPDDMTISEGRYRWSDSITLDVVLIINSDGEIHSINYVENLHETTEDFTYIDIKRDGLYRFVHYVLPIVDWVNRSNLNEDTYYYNNGKYYLRSNNIDEEIGIEDLLTVENLSKDEQLFFMIYYMKTCYDTIVKNILANRKDCKTRNINYLKEQRDILTMFIHIIQYHVEFGQFMEAQAVIEKFFKCETICRKPISYIEHYDCGCH